MFYTPTISLCKFFPKFCFCTVHLYCRTLASVLSTQPLPIVYNPVLGSVLLLYITTWVLSLYNCTLNSASLTSITILRNWFTVSISSPINCSSLPKHSQSCRPITGIDNELRPTIDQSQGLNCVTQPNNHTLSKCRSHSAFCCRTWKIPKK